MNRRFLRVLAGLGLAVGIVLGPAAGAASARSTTVIVPPPTRLCYVTPGSILGGGGTSWSDPYILQAALRDSSCGEIWVKQGVYRPTETGNPADAADQTLSFYIDPNVHLYGGFAGTETTRVQRDPVAHVTVLSGDIDHNDASAGITDIDYSSGDIVGNNSYHVVALDGTGLNGIGATTVLDGFTITGGWGTGSVPYNRGGGLYCLGSGVSFMDVPAACSPTLSNLRFMGNYAQIGGGIFADGGSGGSSSPALSRVTFSGNGANYGAAMYNSGLSGTSSPSLTDVTFNFNNAFQSGGAMYNDGAGGTSSPVLRRVTFSNNVATNGNGGAMVNNASAGAAPSASSPSLANVTFYANTASNGEGGAMFNNGTGGVSSPSLANVTFNANVAAMCACGGAVYNEAGLAGVASPTIYNVILWGDGNWTIGKEMFNDGPGAIPFFVADVVQGGCASIAGAYCSGLNQSTDPMLGPLQDNGGFTQTMLATGASAVDLGDETTCLDLNGVNMKDQRGRPRNADGNGDGLARCDIGATEVPTFADVPVPGKEWMEGWIDEFFKRGFTTGCGLGPLIYCPENDVTRAEMAVFLFRPFGSPPPATHVFADMPVVGKEWMEPWVDDFYNRGITTGCGINPLIFCPENHVTRAEMAVFILRAIHAPGWTPPTTSGVFSDVPVAGKEWMESWVDEFYAEGITTGCGVAPLRFCPENNVTRAEMAVFILRAYGMY